MKLQDFASGIEIKTEKTKAEHEIFDDLISIEPIEKLRKILYPEKKSDYIKLIYLNKGHYQIYAPLNGL